MSAISPVRRRGIWIDLLLYPTHTLPTAAAPAVVGVGLAIHNGVFAALPALLGFVSSWLIHVAGVFTDNYRLLAEHPAIREHPELTEAIESGALTLRGLGWAIAACFALAALSGPYLTYAGGIVVPLLGLAGTLASLGYSVGPFSLTKLGIADPVFFLMFGVVAVAGIYYVQAAHVFGAAPGWHVVSQALPPSAFVLGLPAGAIVTNVLLIDDLRDREFDAAKGWRTPPVRFGVRWTHAEFVLLTAFAYAMPFWFWRGLGFSPWILLPLLTAPAAIAIARTVCTHDDFAALFPLTPRTAGLAFLYAALLAVGVAAPG